MVGIPGAGKSFFAENFATTFRTPIVNRGRIQYELFGRLDGGIEEDGVATRAAQLMLDELVKSHKTIIYEGPSGTLTQRRDIIKYANALDYTPLFIWVQTDSSEASRRATNTKKLDGFITDEQFDTAVRSFMVPNPREKIVVISGKHTYHSQLRIVLKYMPAVRDSIIRQDRQERQDRMERPSGSATPTQPTPEQPVSPIVQERSTTRRPFIR